MPTPINFSVAAAPRQGTFQTSTMSMPAGYTLLKWSLDIPITAEYENTANSFASEVHVTPPGGVDGIYQSAGWTGGHVTYKGGVVDPMPTIAVGVENIPAGAAMFVRISVPNAMTIGIINGSLT